MPQHKELLIKSSSTCSPKHMYNKLILIYSQELTTGKYPKVYQYRNGWDVTAIRCHTSVRMNKVTTACNSAAESYVCYSASSFQCVDTQMKSSSPVLQGSGAISLEGGGKDSEGASICQSCSAS